VVCDRYVDSSLAYQGLARGLGLERVLDLNLAATQSLMPDRTFLVLLDPAESVRRSTGDPDRIEAEGLAFQSAVDRAFREVASLFPERIATLDGRQPAADLARIVRDDVRERA
jgi:dTMP kinase